MRRVQHNKTITRDAALSHFLLMFGYKLFSFYFSLFLIEKGLSLPQVGYTYLLVYLPIALFSPVAGFLNHKINPALLACFGIGGYGLYSFGLLFGTSHAFFYILQIILGISAALFFVSMRTMLITFSRKNPSHSFSWFYSAPFYADVLAPLAGALIIWRFGFSGVFLVSFCIHAFNVVFSIRMLRAKAETIKDSLRFSQIAHQYRVAFHLFKNRAIAPIMFVSFAALITGGFYQAFFVLFLKDLGWTQNNILLFGTISSILFVPISWYIIRQMRERGNATQFFQGITLYSASSIVLGADGMFLQFFSILFLGLIKDFGSLMANSVRSGTVSKAFSRHSEEAGAIDTIFSPLGQSLGFLIGSFLLGSTGYPLLFIGGGVFVFAASMLGRLSMKNHQVAKTKISV